MSIICSGVGNFPCITVIAIFVYLFTGPMVMRRTLHQNVYRISQTTERCGDQVQGLGQEVEVCRPRRMKRVTAARARRRLYMSLSWEINMAGEYLRLSVTLRRYLAFVRI